MGATTEQDNTEAHSHADTSTKNAQPLVRMDPTVPLHYQASKPTDVSQVPFDNLILLHNISGNELGHRLLKQEQENVQLRKDNYQLQVQLDDT
jgi:hypothetical protein